MKITRVDIPASVITGPADDECAQRSSGLHLSQIYSSLVDDLDRSKSEQRKGAFPLPLLEVYRSAGFVWERAFSTAMANGLAGDDWQRTGEWHKDGIAGSPDLIGVRDWVIGETKFTWKSTRQLDEFESSGTGGLWVWGVQMKGYCHMVGTNRARLFAFFVNGDYRTMQPVFAVRDIEFTALELRENWQMLLSHAKAKKWL